MEGDERSSADTCADTTADALEAALLVAARADDRDTVAKIVDLMHARNRDRAGVATLDVERKRRR